eukprot:scaffold142446_cov32-Tisochrysis_lutea.AAC.3
MPSTVCCSVARASVALYAASGSSPAPKGAVQAEMRWFLGCMSRSSTIRRDPRPEPVPPPNECASITPGQKSVRSHCQRSASRAASHTAPPQPPLVLPRNRGAPPASATVGPLKPAAQLLPRPDCSDKTH